MQVSEEIFQRNKSEIENFVQQKVLQILGMLVKQFTVIIDILPCVQ